MAFKRLAQAALLGTLLTTLVGCVSATPRPSPVPLAKVDLGKIYGGWYIVGGMPNLLERGIVDSYDHYAPAPGGITENFWMRRGGFDKKRQHFVVRIDILPGTNDADWRVKPIWPLRLPFQVIWVDPDGKFMLFGEQVRKWGWIYARNRKISDTDYAAMLEHFRLLGWDITKFRKTVQVPEDIGKPGYWSDGIRPVAAT